ncbi:hypothetical protein D9M71_471420 [compost metagenome]
MCLAVPALSRACPLPQVQHKSPGLCYPCGSGHAREEARTGAENAELIPVSAVYPTLNYADTRIPRIICAQARSLHDVDASAVGRLPGAGVPFVRL